MTNEEKIIAILEEHSKLLEGLGQKVADMDEILTKTAIIQEQEVIPKLNLLYEHQVSIMEKLIPISRIEALEDDVATLKTVVRILSDKVTELQKAQ